MNYIRSRKGFTLIELLVVVSIISLLSSIVFTSLDSARMKARDARRITDLRAIRTALELYFDFNGSYPIIAKWATADFSGTPLVSWTSLQTALASYISKLPSDPKPTGVGGPWSNGNYHYYYASEDGKVYDLLAQLEDPNNPNRCAIRQWRYHIGENPYPPEYMWCGVYSPYLLADH